MYFPEVFEKSQRFDLDQDDYTLLYRAMGSLPRDYAYLARDTHYYDTFVKFFISDDKNYRMPDNLHVLNKVGWAYGYLTDCSYIFDTDSGAEFLLTATILANGDGIFNDDKYDYEKQACLFWLPWVRRFCALNNNANESIKANFAKYHSPK
ncbi:MAG: hypothetical protein IPN29_13915 [Saprospiraceae bacterium]|nr:hypothetical protein [Saprospiraceae bacterium]